MPGGRIRRHVHLPMESTVVLARSISSGPYDTVAGTGTSLEAPVAG